MGRDLYDASSAARAVFDTADRVLGYKLSSVCFEGPEERLRETEYAQPAIFTMSLACLAAAVESGAVRERPAFRRRPQPRRVQRPRRRRRAEPRGRPHADPRARPPHGERLDVEQGGTLAAVMGLDEAAVDALCAEADVDVCNLNLPSQTVIGGTRASRSRVSSRWRKNAAPSAPSELNVGGAFHSRLMRPAAAGLAEAVASAPISDPTMPLVANASATALTTAQAVREELGAQVARPVRWHESVTLMAAAGVTRFIEFGPGRVLTGLARRIVDGAELVNINGWQTPKRRSK